jgi:uncharacterized alkaline shock family protein YloU
MSDRTDGAPSESVHSPAVSAHISHAVIATYAAAAVLDVPGVHGLGGGGMGTVERRVAADRPHRAVRVAADDGDVDLELQVITEWDAPIPRVAAEVERGVRSYLASMIELNIRSVTVFVEDVVAPGG